MPLIQGQILNNRYRIVRLLGQGGFGAVYRAWDTTLNVPCAVKESLELSPEGQRQFLREAQILAGLRHPNLPRVTDYFALTGQGQYLVMDFVEGQDLEEMKALAGGRLPENQALNYIAQACDALAYMHRQQPPVIHRDIKPANIKITPPDEDAPYGRAMLVDFGVAKVFDPHLRTTVGARAVTPGYSPHEQYGQTGVVTDVRTDMYALGATLYSLLTGQEPLESILRVVDDTLIPPSQIEPTISTPTEAIILHAMQVNPSRRYQNAADFKQALNAQLAASGQHSVVTQPPIAAPAPAFQGSKGSQPAQAAPPIPAAPGSSGSQPAPAASPAPVGQVSIPASAGSKPTLAPAPAPVGQASTPASAGSKPAPRPVPAPAAQPSAAGKPGRPLAPLTLAATETPPARPARAIPWKWIGLGGGALLALALVVALVVLLLGMPASAPVPLHYWVAVMSRGTDITTQAFWTSSSYAEIEAFIRGKLDAGYQITDLEFSDGTWVVVLSRGTDITTQAFWYSSDYAKIQEFIQGKLDESYQITDLEYSDGKWAVVMSQGTDITTQAYWYSSSYAEIETFIQGKLDAGYQISDLDYSDGRWVVVLSRGTTITRQAYWYSSDYAKIEAFIRGKLDEGYQITDLEHSDGRWVVVLSQGTEISSQAFWFSSDYAAIEAFIRGKLDEGYQITGLSR
jgi:serine/threonine protein kinase